MALTDIPTSNGTGGVPPSSLEAEQAVLGAVLLSDQTLYTLRIEINLLPEDFSGPSHGAIWEAMLALYGQGEPVDKLTVVEKLKQSGRIEDAGGAAAIEALAAAPPVVGNAGQYGKIVKETALVRGLLTATYRIQQQVSDHAGNPVILAARPSMGKSALAANFLENAAVRHGRPAVMFSLEMGESELAQRFIASQGSIKGNDLRRGKVSWPKVTSALKALSAAPLWIHDSSDLSVLDIRAKARRLAQQVDGDLGLIVVDYLQLMRADSRSDSVVEQIGEISKGLKTLARELKVPVIALSQLSRAVEQRHEKVPMLSDLRSSGQIEQDADLVMFIYREEYYEEDSEHQGEAELIISKHRNGGLGNVPLVFQHEYPRFMPGIRDAERYAA